MANTFVDEYILRLADNIGQDFYRQYQAGFTTSFQPPIIGGCDCAKVEGKSARGCSLFYGLGPPQCNSAEECPMFGLTDPSKCPLKLFNESGLCKTEPSCYSIEPYSLDYFFVSYLYH